MRGIFWTTLLTLSALAGLGAIVYFIMDFATSQVGLPKVYWFVPVFGAAGGAVGAILRNDNKLLLCRIDRPDRILLGVVGDMSVGLGGACAIVFLFGNTLRVDPDDALSGVLLISMSFLAGAFGKNIVERAGEKLLAQAKEEAKAVAEEQVADPAAVAFSYAAGRLNEAEDRKYVSQALDMANQALRYNPTSIHAYVEKGRALKRLGRVKEALGTVEEALRIQPDDPRLLYNRACYMALLKMDNEAILADLKRACKAEPQLCEQARRDSDLAEVVSLTPVREWMLAAVEEALQSRPDSGGPEAAVLWYSKACYMALLGLGEEETLAALKRAFTLEPKLKRRAQADADLTPFHDLPEFRELLPEKPA